MSIEKTQAGVVTRTQPGADKRAVFSGGLGSALEYFDFAIYGALSASLFPKLFFDGLGDNAALLASLATFGVGFAARPAGGLVFGHLGDRIGRHPVLYITLLVMGVSSVAIGLLPTGGGMAVATLLIVLRFLQGFSLGGEATGNQIMSMEHARPHQRGLFGSLVNVGSPISQVVANLVLVVLTTILSEHQWETWGWRIPFLASILLVLVTIYIRFKLEETPAFKVNQLEQQATGGKQRSGLSVIASQPAQIIKLTLCWGGLSMTYYLIAVYGLAYLRDNLNIPTDTTFIIFVLANIVGAFACVIGGYVSDRIGRKSSAMIGLIGSAVGVLTFFYLSSEASNMVFLVFLASIPIASVQFASGVQPALFAEQFPTPIRFAGSSVSFTLTNLIFAAPAPLVAAALVTAGGPHLVMWVTLAVIAMSMGFMFTIKDRSGLDLVAFTDYATESAAMAPMNSSSGAHPIDKVATE